MKKILLFLLVILVACKNDPEKKLALINFAPKDAGLLMKVPNMNSFTNALNKNAFLKVNSDFPLFQNLKEKLTALQFSNSEKPALLSFSPEGKNDIVFAFISEVGSKGIPKTLKQQTSDSIFYNNFYIKRIQSGEKNNFYTTINDVFILSDSKLVIEDIIRQKDFPIGQDLLNVYNAANNQEVSVLINHQNIDDIVNSLLPNKTFLDFQKFADWTAVDFELEKESLKLNGITTAPEANSAKIINIFQNTAAQTNEIAKIIPLSAIGFYAFTYDDFEILKNNIADYHINRAIIPQEKEAFFALFNEVGITYLKNAEALALKTQNPDKAEDEIQDISEKVKDYREVEIFKISKGNIFRETFNPLVKISQLSHFAILDQFFIFAKDVETLELIIANYQNGTVLENEEFYKETASQLSSESSFLLVAINKNFKKSFAAQAAGKFQNEIKELATEDFPIVALQFIHDKDFAHVHGILAKKPKSTVSKGSINQIATASLKANLATQPMIFENHYNNENEIVVQDENNVLYLLSKSGEILWSKELDGPILGDIEIVDLFKNTKLQMAFATPNKFHILDRNGNTVKPFPISFKEPITQPLAVFDYDNNRKYRFLVVQNNKLKMFNAEGKTVSGFDFNKANSEIIKTPKHIRIGIKDYILVPEASGKLNILSRQGNSRVDVKEQIDFSENDWFLHKNSFASTNAEGNLILINQEGKIKTEDLSLTENHQIQIAKNLLVSFSENVLKINKKELELPYGIYSEPKIHELKNKTFVSITDKQAHQVYVYNEKGELLPNFPVYGSSAIALANFDVDKQLEFVVQGEDDGILFYEIN